MDNKMKTLSIYNIIQVIHNKIEGKMAYIKGLIEYSTV